MRLDLPNGQYADLAERLTYGQARTVRAVYVAMGGDRNVAVDLDITLVRAYVTDWHVLDLDGKTVPLDHAEQAPDDIIQAISLAASGLWKRAGTPKGNGAATSPTTSPAPPFA